MYVLEEIMGYFLIKRHRSYFKYNDLLHSLTVYKNLTGKLVQISTSPQTTTKCWKNRLH